MGVLWVRHSSSKNSTIQSWVDSQLELGVWVMVLASLMARLSMSRPFQLLDSSKLRQRAISLMCLHSLMVAWCCLSAQTTLSSKATGSLSYLVRHLLASLALVADLCLSAEAVTNRNSPCQQATTLSM